MITREQVLAALKRVMLPGSGADIVCAGLVSDIAIADGAVMFAINVEPAGPARWSPSVWPPKALSRHCRASSKATVALTAERAPARRSPQRAPQRARELRGAFPASVTSSPSLRARAASANRPPPSISRLGSRHLGLSVAVLDADVYGPSLPKLLGITGRPQADAGGA